MVLYGSNDGIPSSGSSSPTECAEEMCSYMVIKHSWKGKYKRVFSIGSSSITTYNPGSMEPTNQWMYSDFISILPAAKGQVCGKSLYLFFLLDIQNSQASAPNNEFIITFKKGKKTDSMRFSSEHRASIITEAMR